MNKHIKYDSDTKLFWPCYEKNPLKVYKYITEKISRLNLAISYCQKKRLAIQAGGHIGVLPSHLSVSKFQQVVTFEADEHCFECLHENASRSISYNMHLGNSEKEVDLYYITPGRSGRITRYYREGAETFKSHQVTIDSMDFDNCDLISLNIGGNEAQALRGAVLTINAYRPVIYLEPHPSDADECDRFLLKRNYEIVSKSNTDRIYIPEESDAVR